MTAAAAIEATNLIDKAEQAYRTTHGRFTPHLADLVTPRLANDLANGAAVRLDVGADGQRYLAQVASNDVSLVRGRNGAKLTAQSCVTLKNSSHVSCPQTTK